MPKRNDKKKQTNKIKQKTKDGFNYFIMATLSCQLPVCRCPGFQALDHGKRRTDDILQTLVEIY